MADQIPVILDDDGELKRLPTGDTLADRNGTPYYPGLSGAGGGITTSYTFSTTVTDSDPGPGTLRLNNATQNTAIELYLDDLDADGNDWSVLAGIPPIANPIGDKKAYVRLSVAGDSSRFIVWLLTATTDESGYFTLYGTVYNSSAASPFTNGELLVVTFTQNGDPGADGSDAAITPGTTDNAIVRADGTGNDAIQGSTATISDLGVLTLIEDSTLYPSGAQVPVLSIKDAAANSVFDVTAHTTGGNIGLGVGTTDAITTGLLNIGLGGNALTAVSTGNSNVGIGAGAGTAITTGSSNMCIGTNSALLLSTGNSNVCIGTLSGATMTGGNNAVYIGTAAGQNLSGGGSVAIGTSALQNGGAGGNNVAIGTSSGINYTSSNSTFVGAGSGGLVTSGNNNAFIGYNAGNVVGQLAACSGSVIIGPSARTLGINSVVVGASSYAGVNGVVLGNNLTGAANQVILGNTSVTDTIIRGQADIGRAFTANDAGGDFDTRIEGDTLPYMLFLDASAATENIALVTDAAPNWQSMDRGIFIGNSSTIPAGNPTNGGFLYVEGGALKWRGPAGTVTTIAPG